MLDIRKDASNDVCELRFGGLNDKMEAGKKLQLRLKDVKHAHNTWQF